jgi:hypothetical protein
LGIASGFPLKLAVYLEIEEISFRVGRVVNCGVTENARCVTKSGKAIILLQAGYRLLNTFQKPFRVGRVALTCR